MKHTPNKKRHHKHRKNVITPFKDLIIKLRRLDFLACYAEGITVYLATGEKRNEAVRPENSTPGHLKRALAEAKKVATEAMNIIAKHPEAWRTVQMHTAEELRDLNVLGEKRLRVSAPLRKVNSAKRPDDSDRSKRRPAVDRDTEDRLTAPYHNENCYGDGCGNPKCEPCTKRILAGDFGKEEQEKLRCHRPPRGWMCTRAKGHEGPCAAHPIRELRPKKWEGAKWIIEHIPHSGRFTYAVVETIPAVPRSNIRVKWHLDPKRASSYATREAALSVANRMYALQHHVEGILALVPVSQGLPMTHERERLAEPVAKHHDIDCDCPTCYGDQG